MSRFRIALGGLAAATGLLISVGAASAATTAPPSASAHAVAAPIGDLNCPSGDACMYTKNGLQNKRTEHIYKHDGCYPLHHEFGIRYIYNRQAGNEKVRLFTSGPGANSCTGRPVYKLPDGLSGPIRIGPINSLSLEP